MPRLLGVYLVEVDEARGFEGGENRGLGDFVEDDALGGFQIQIEGLREVPGNRASPSRSISVAR